MHVNPPLPDDGQPDITPDQAATERRCLVLGEALPRAQLIRFVVGPQHQVFPDIDEKLPGRGLWVSACRDKLAHAIKKNLFAKAARASAKPAADLLELTISLLQQKSLSLMGLANKAGVVVHGFPQVQAAAKAHQLSLLLTAPDAGADGLRKLAPFALPMLQVLDSAQLGRALGHDALTFVGLCPHPLTTKVQENLQKLAGLLALPPQSMPHNT